jgi:glutathione peroxidase
MNHAAGGLPMDRRSFLALMAVSAASPAAAQAPGMSARTCFAFSFDKLEGGQLRLGDYAGKPILIVNTASLCGYTPQYTGLQTLWSTLGPRGLMMIGVPSNNFGGQEPGGVEEITHTAHSYGVGFPLAAKAKVLGADAHPFYRWAAAEKPRETPRWNFHKYLIGRDGHVAASFATAVEPTDPRVISAIEREFSSGPTAG